MSGVVFQIRLRAEEGSGGLRSLKAVIKHALRAHGLRCIGIALVDDDDAPSEDTDPAPERGKAERTNG
jgi:hypothetical protein